MEKADHERRQVDEAIGQMVDFKSGLARFSRTYAYIAQLIDLGDPELENLASFTKLLSKRLDGIPPDQIDLSGIRLTGYDIQTVDMPGQLDSDDEETDLALKPIGPGGSPAPGGLPVYLQELIERLNGIFGEAAPLKDQANFVNHIAAIARENEIVMAQVEKNPKEQALKGNLPGAIQAAVVRAMASNSSWPPPCSRRIARASGS
ncbi:MAG: hypothetical protein R8G60_09610 [Roseovarius pacificus]|nr:hypothetical protein [Roseovarius pacificus]